MQDALDDTDEPLGSRQRERVVLGRRNALRLERLVDNLLDFSRVEADRADLRARPTDLAAFTTELVSVFRSAAERAGLELRIEAPPLPRLVSVDRQMWEKVVLNLLSNAVKFTFVGSITVSVHDAGGHARVVVADTGVGIDPADLPHVFERFYRVRGAQSRSHEGSGIGLALVHRLLDAHHATIDLRSTPGRGTSFTIDIPYTQPATAAPSVPEPDDELVLPASAAPSARALSYLAEAQSWVVRADASPPAAATTEPAARPVLLLAEDNADMAAYLTRVLAQHWQVHHHRDGREALEALRAGAYRGAESSLPDLVLADVMMPRMDGVELVRAIRRDLGLTQLPVVLLTARAGQDAALQGLAAGADDYLTKPFTSLDLLTRLHTPPARRRSQRHLLLPAPGDHRRSTSSRSRGARPETRPHRAAHGGRPAGGAPRRRRLLHRRGLARDDVDGLVLAVGEVASNAVEHRDPTSTRPPIPTRTSTL